MSDSTNMSQRHATATRGLVGLSCYCRPTITCIACARYRRVFKRVQARLRQAAR